VQWFEHPQQFAEVDRLLENCIRMLFANGTQAVLVVDSRCHQHFGGRLIAAKQPQNVLAVTIGEHQIQNDVRGIFRKPGKSFGKRGGDDDFKPAAAKDRRKRVATDPIIFNQQHRSLCRRSLRHWRAVFRAEMRFFLR
jgi:hypothetical protein